MAFSFWRFASSLNITCPNFGRSSVPSGRKISRPNSETIRLKPRVPGATTSRASTSASMIGIPCDASRDDTVDFPVAIPPVRPITFSECQ